MIEEIKETINEVQKFLKEEWGEETYQYLVSKMKGETNDDPQILAGILGDNSLPMVARLLATACLGE